MSRTEESVVREKLEKAQVEKIYTFEFYCCFIQFEMQN